MKHLKTLIPILMMLMAMNLVSLGDTGGKLLTQHEVDPTFIAWARFALGAICLLPFCRLRLHDIPTLFTWPILLRSFLIACAILSILTSLNTEPFANAISAFFIAPIISYFLAAYFLKETITLPRTILLLFGFCGILLVVKPGANMSVGMLFALLAGCFYSGYLVSSRWLINQYRPRLLLISQLVFGAIMLSPVGLREIPNVANVEISFLIILSALASALGNLLLIEANRRVPANIIAPLVYTQVLFATFYGVVVFNTWPDNLSLIGIIIVLSSGFGSWFIAGREADKEKPTNS